MVTNLHIYSDSFSKTIMSNFKHPFATVVITLLSLVQAHAQTTQKVVDIPTRPSVTLRVIVLSPPEPKATVVLFAGGHGGLRVFSGGSMAWGEGNFLIRTRQMFADQGLMVVVIDAPSDRQFSPYLDDFRQKPEHAADIKAVIAWLRQSAQIPVWLIGTSRGTQSVGFVATELSGSDAPDGIVLSSTILTDDKGRPVPGMALDKIRVPVLVVHHEQDGCRLCSFLEVPKLMAKLVNAPRSKVLAFNGGVSQGDPCGAFSHHGFNGLESEVVRQTAAWMLTK